MKRKVISKEKLAKVYSKHTTAEACKMLGVSPPTLRKLVKSAGIKMKGRGSREGKLVVK